MHLAVYLPLLMPLLAAATAWLLAGRLPPVAATWLLAGSAVALAAASSAVLGLLGRGPGYKVWIRPPSMTKSAPVMFEARSLARKSTKSATSSGRVKRPVTIWLAALLATSCGAAPVAALTVWATPPCPSHRSVATGPGLTVLTRIPRGRLPWTAPCRS